MQQKEFTRLEKIFQDLYAEGRVKELLRLAFKLLELESGSGKVLRFLLVRLPGDTVFSHKAFDLAAAFEKSSVFFRLAEICRDRGAFTEMDKLLARYLAEGRDELVSFLALCLAGDLPKAYALVPALLKNDPSPETLLLAADPWRNLFRTSRIKPALAAVDSALKNIKGPAKSLASLHRFILAEKAGLSPVFKQPPFPGRAGPVLCLPAAEILLDRLEFKKAEELFGAAAEAWPASELACGKLAETLFCSGREEAALELMAGKQGLVLSPGFRAWRGQFLLFGGAYKEAVKELEKPIASGNVLGWCWRGAALFKLGLSGPALKDLDTAVKLNPDDLEARVWRAELLRTQKKYKSALEDLDQTLRIMPEHPWALANLALLAAERGDAGAFSAAFWRLPAGIRLACGRTGKKPAALAALLERLKGVRRHEPRFFHALLPAN